MSAVKKFLFGSTSVPDVDIKQSAPQIDNPVHEVKSPELGGQSSEERNKKKGKSSLKITPTTTSTERGVGLNV